jgi:hypothetical protein
MTTCGFTPVPFFRRRACQRLRARPRTRLLLALVAATLSAMGSRGEPSGHRGASTASDPRAADTLSIFFTAETRGNLEPCACPHNPQGGLARRTGFLRAAADAVRARGGTALVLDAGGFLPEGEVPLRDDPTVLRRLTALMLESMTRAGVDAVALDRTQRGFLEKTAPREARRLQSAFLEADPPDPPHVVPWGRHRVAVIALEETLNEDVIEAAASQAQAQGNVVVVLGRADAVSGRRLARLSRADLLILSRGARPERTFREGTSTLVGCGTQGKEVGEIRMVLDENTPGGRATVRVTKFALHSMEAGTAVDDGIAGRVEALIRDAGPLAFTRHQE